LERHVPHPSEKPPNPVTARLNEARSHRLTVQRAAQGLMSRIAAGDPIEISKVLEVGAFLTQQIITDPYGLVALTSLRQCDDYTVEHCVDVSILMVALGHRLGRHNEELHQLAVAGLLHDVGKQRVPEEILQKPDKLTAEEFQVMKKHPEWGFELVSQLEGCSETVANVTLRHHERLNGSGYPFGLMGLEIDAASRIAGVADVFDALTSDRVYRRGFPTREALQLIFRIKDSHFDESVVGALIKLVGVYPIGTEVLLSTGERAVVVEPNPEDTTRPIVEITRDTFGRWLNPPRRLVLQGSEDRIVSALRSDEG
jgi:putative nucleotidyltransferase with HDIG domain